MQRTCVPSSDRLEGTTPSVRPAGASSCRRDAVLRCAHAERCERPHGQGARSARLRRLHGARRGRGALDGGVLARGDVRRRGARPLLRRRRVLPAPRLGAAPAGEGDRLRLGGLVPVREPGAPGQRRPRQGEAAPPAAQGALPRVHGDGRGRRTEGRLPRRGAGGGAAPRALRRRRRALLRPSRADGGAGRQGCRGVPARGLARPARGSCARRSQSTTASATTALPTRTRARSSAAGPA